MANQLNKFDQQIKNSFEGYEVPYDSHHWDELQSELNSATPSMTSYFGAITTGLVATGIVFVAMLFFVSDANVEGKRQAIVEETPVEIVDGSGSKIANQATSGTDTQVASNIETSGSDSDQDETIENSISKSSELDLSKNTNKNFAAKKSTQSSKADHKKAVTPPVPVKTIKGKAGSENAASVKTGCTGMVINFTASEKYGADAKYLWNFGDGFFSNEPNPSHTFNKEGVFDVSLSVTSKNTGQISSNVVQAMIEVIDAPTANMEIHIASPTDIVVKNDSYNAGELAWNLNNNAILDKNEIKISVADNTRQSLMMSVSNEGGCTDTLETIINSIKAGSEFPRVLTSAFGAHFAPGAILNKGDVTSIKIFEKSTGALIFSGMGNKGWNGTDAQGKQASPGQYNWVMVVEKSDMIDVYKGVIELR